MSVQKKSLISQRNSVTKAIVATSGEQKHATAKVAAKVAAKVSPKVFPKTAPKIVAACKGKVFVN